MLTKGVKEDSVNMMVNSITDATLKQYQSILKCWWKFAHEKGWDIYNAKTTDILSFLSKRFNDVASYSVLNTSRSTILQYYYNKDIFQNGLISKFLKGVFRKRPTKPKYSSI